MAQRGHELATDLYILNHIYRNSEVPHILANAICSVLVHLYADIACHIDSFIQIYLAALGSK
jgi:hypothetical protein